MYNYLVHCNTNTEYYMKVIISKENKNVKCKNGNVCKRTIGNRNRKKKPMFSIVRIQSTLKLNIRTLRVNFFSKHTGKIKKKHKNYKIVVSQE